MGAAYSYVRIQERIGDRTRDMDHDKTDDYIIQKLTGGGVGSGSGDHISYNKNHSGPG